MSGIAITGANGFIGGALLKSWSGRTAIRAVARSDGARTLAPDVVAVGDINGQTDWSQAVTGIEAIVHCAGRAHMLRDTARNPVAAFRRINVDATVGLARAAAQAGVKRFIYLSSVAVMGDAMRGDGLVRLSDIPRPNKAYGQSKYEAELALAALSRETVMEIFIIRPPMVYGAGAPANFHRLMTIVDRRFPLPFGAVTAPRSFVGIDNLADMLWICAAGTGARPGTYFASDGCDISTAEFIRSIGRCMKKPAVLVPVPLPLLRMAGHLLGRSDDMERLINPIRVEADGNAARLGWKPSKSVEFQLEKAVSDFLRRKR